MTFRRASLMFLWLALTAFFTLGGQAQVASNSFPGAAARITFTFQGRASGAFQPEFGAVKGFSDEPFTITATIQAGDIARAAKPCAVPSGDCQLWVAPVVSANITVGGATATITTPLAIFDNQTYPAVGLQRKTGADLLDLQGSPAFITYDLAGDLDLREVFFKNPTGVGQFDCVHGCVMTSRGSLTVRSVQNVEFTAALARSAQ
jgi:hypothetical protein